MLVLQATTGPFLYLPDLRVNATSENHLSGLPLQISIGANSPSPQCCLCFLLTILIYDLWLWFGGFPVPHQDVSSRRPGTCVCLVYCAVYPSCPKYSKRHRVVLSNEGANEQHFIITSCTGWVAPSPTMPLYHLHPHKRLYSDILATFFFKYTN